MSNISHKSNIGRNIDFPRTYVWLRVFVFFFCWVDLLSNFYSILPLSVRIQSENVCFKNNKWFRGKCAHFHFMDSEKFVDNFLLLLLFLRRRLSLCDALPALLLWVKLYFSQNGYRIFSLLLLFYIFHNYYVLFYFCLWFIIESFSFLRSLFTTPTWLCVRTVFVVVIDSFDKSMFYHVSECWMRKKSQNNKQPKKAPPQMCKYIIEPGFIFMLLEFNFLFHI